MGRGLQKFEFRFEGDQYAGPEFRILYGRDSQDAPVAQKIAHGGPGAYQKLQREVRIGRILVQRIGKNEYPVCLSRLIGYNPGTAENVGPFPPYAVFTYQRGTLADLADELPLRPELLRPVTDGLIIALCYLQAAQVVHRHLRLDTVHWDGTTVQLADFADAAAEWEENPGAVGLAPWDAPEQRAGAASADCRDDSYAAALLLTRLITGQEFTDDEEAREAIARLDLTQQNLLQDTAAEYRRDRPTAYELRKRRRLPDPLNPVLRATRGHESEARARFASLRQRQRSALRSQQAPAAGARGGSSRAPEGSSPAPDWWQRTPAGRPEPYWSGGAGGAGGRRETAESAASAWPAEPASSKRPPPSRTGTTYWSTSSGQRTPARPTGRPQLARNAAIGGVLFAILLILVFVL
jgi:serine/threonine protein kinase